MEPPKKKIQKIYTKAERVYDKLMSLREKIKSFRDMERRLDGVRREIINTEQRLYDVQIATLKDIKCVSITLLKLIHKNAPDAPILSEYAELLSQEHKWCQHHHITLLN